MWDSERLREIERSAEMGAKACADAAALAGEVRRLNQGLMLARRELGAGHPDTLWLRDLVRGLLAGMTSTEAAAAARMSQRPEDRGHPPIVDNGASEEYWEDEIMAAQLAQAREMDR